MFNRSTYISVFNHITETCSRSSRSSSKQSLYQAIKNNDLDTLKKLIANKRTDIDSARTFQFVTKNTRRIIKKDLTPLMLAIKFNRIEAAKLLLKNNALVDVKGENGRTALHYAVSKKDPDFCSLLLKYDARIDIKDSDGDTALHLAAEYPPLFDYLLKTRPEAQRLLTSKNNFKETPKGMSKWYRCKLEKHLNKKRKRKPAG